MTCYPPSPSAREVCWVSSADAVCVTATRSTFPPSPSLFNFFVALTPGHSPLLLLDSAVTLHVALCPDLGSTHSDQGPSRMPASPSLSLSVPTRGGLSPAVGQMNGWPIWTGPREQGCLLGTCYETFLFSLKKIVRAFIPKGLC